MKNEQYSADRLARLFRTKKIATMDELKRSLGTSVDMTVFRKLQELDYQTSYSHRGGYYTLEEIAEFDELGLWSFRSVWFSKHGTLLSTAEACVNSSEAGYFAGELESLLHVSVKDALRKLVSEDRIARETISGRYLYCALDSELRKEQVRARHVYESESIVAPLPIGPGVRLVPDELKAAIILFFSLLDEQQKRLYAGLEALKLGHGGDRKMAELLGLDVGTVARGRQQLLGQDVEIERVRKTGGGRASVEKKRQRSSEESKS
ncbi:MAG: hypothetical protein ACREBW_06395 [Candidatus Micrarchaeaceae archaeon]